MPAGEYTFAVNRQNRTIAIFQNDKGIGSFLLGSPNDGSNNGRTLLTFRTNNEDVYVLQKLQEADCLPWRTPERRRLALLLANSCDCLL